MFFDQNRLPGRFADPRTPPPGTAKMAQNRTPPVGKIEDFLKTGIEGQNLTQDGQKRSQDGPKTAQGSPEANQEASKTAQEPTRQQKCAKTLCFTGRNWPPEDQTTPPDGGVGEASGGRFGGGDRTEI